MSPRTRYGLALGGTLGFVLGYALSGLMGWPLPTYDPVSGLWHWSTPGDPMHMRYYGQLAAGVLTGALGALVGGLLAPRVQSRAPLAVWWLWTAMLWLVGMLAASLWL
ncbi:MAG: hypothetical protein ACE366_26395 [Bradymonadia bacterium]